MATAPEPVAQPYHDALEVFHPPQQLRSTTVSPVSPNSPPPHYGGNDDGLIPDTRDSAYKPWFVPAVAPVTMGDSENAGAVAQKKRLRDRRACGMPLFWFLALLAFVLLAAIVGGVVGGVLGTKKKDPVVAAAAAAAPTSAQTKPDDPSTTPTSSISSSTSSSTSSSAMPMPTALFQPRSDTWYYLHNDLLDPTVLVALTWGGDGAAESHGDVSEHWAFWPAMSNSTAAADFAISQKIDSMMYYLYNREDLQMEGFIAPNLNDLNNKFNWYYFSPHPQSPYVYLQNAYMGKDYAYTLLDTGVTGADRFTTSWDKSWKLTKTDGVLGGEEIRKGQAWEPVAAFMMSPGEKRLWDAPIRSEDD